jgi:GH35 family endo-1,4-beta-xylanase
MDYASRQRIAEHRRADVRLNLTDSHGASMPNKNVQIHQTQHHFLFGCNLFKLHKQETAEQKKVYEDAWLGLFNFATLPFYWGRYEPVQGRPQVDELSALAAWCHQHDVTPKGHPLVWTIEPEWISEPFSPPDGEWASEGQTADAKSLLDSRIRREVQAFKGKVEMWDVINEVVNGPNQARERGALCLSQLYDRYGQHELIRRSFEVAREANPEATLLINEHRRFTGYEELLNDALDSGVQIDAIGLQSHMLHRYWGTEELWEVCERFAKYGLPIHFTEVSIPSGIDLLDAENHLTAAEDVTTTRWKISPQHEEMQAERVIAWYTTLFSHPAVEAITWWDLTDRNAFQGAPIGLLRPDTSRKPAYTALEALIKEQWWTKPISTRTDDKGHLRLEGFLGKYVIETEGQCGEFWLEDPGATQVDVALETIQG